MKTVLDSPSTTLVVKLKCTHIIGWTPDNKDDKIADIDLVEEIGSTYAVLTFANQKGLKI